MAKTYQLASSEQFASVGGLYGRVCEDVQGSRPSEITECVLYLLYATAKLSVGLCTFKAPLTKNHKSFSLAQLIKLEAQHTLVYVNVEPMIWQAQMDDFSAT